MGRSTPWAWSTRLLAVAALLATAAPAADAATRHMVSGRIVGLPSGKGVSVTVEAVSVRSDALAATRSVSGSAYAVQVPAGPTFVMADVVDIRRHRQLVGYTAVDATRSLRGVTLRLRAGAGAGRAGAAAVGGGSSVSISTIPIFGPDGRLPGGAEAGLINGMLPVCQAHGGKLIDGSDAFKRARAVEMGLAAEGRLDFNLGPWAQPVSDFGVDGTVRVGPNGGPLADIHFIAKDGRDIHFVVSGDPSDWDNIGGFMSRLGDHIIQNAFDHEMACGKASKPPTPPPPVNHLRCHAGKGKVCVTFTGSAVASQQTPSATAIATSDTVHWDVGWSASADGNGEVIKIVRGSSAGGSGTVVYNPATMLARCNTTFALSRTFPPSIVERQPGYGKLTIEVPDPVVHSMGTGAGYPPIQEQPACGALISAAVPGNFTVTVPLRPGTTTRSVSGGGPYMPGPGGSGSSTMHGTITVQVG